MVARGGLALFLVFLAAGAYAGNALRDHPSPYLALHGEDPVAWRDWDDAVLAEARELNRPLFISSGYFACHWCHVMQRESFRNEAIATFLNEHFVPVKLDRELNPALDDYLIRFVEQTRGLAGWPLNVFVTPEGYPLAGLTYVPPAELSALLERLASQWQNRAAAISALARAAAEELLAAAERPEPPQRMPAAADIARALHDDALGLADELGGGFGHQSKFPMEPQLLALLSLQEQFPEERLAGFLGLTLREMARRGLRDHLAGGFFRYTVDPDWRTPHYEKMLYNQALLARVYLNGARVLEEPAFADVARDTLDFVLDNMAGQDGGFVASLSALDAAGEEGGSYLWSVNELDRLLTREEKIIAVAWWSLDPDLSPSAGLLPQRLVMLEEAAAATGVTPDEVGRQVPEIRRKLLAQRAKRRPPRDTKQLAGWNGLLLWALAEASIPLEEPRYGKAAAGIASFLRTLWDGERLSRARDGVRMLGEPALEDYAFVAAGLTAWSRATGDPQHRALARDVALAGWRRHFVVGRGWRMDAGARLPAMPLDRAMEDGALPAASGVMMRISGDLLPGLPENQLVAAAGLSADLVSEAPFWHASHAIALMRAGARYQLRE